MMIKQNTIKKVGLSAEDAELTINFKKLTALFIIVIITIIVDMQTKTSYNPH